MKSRITKCLSIFLSLIIIVGNLSVSAKASDLNNSNSSIGENNHLNANFSNHKDFSVQNIKVKNIYDEMYKNNIEKKSKIEKKDNRKMSIEGLKDSHKKLIQNDFAAMAEFADNDTETLTVYENSTNGIYSSIIYDETEDAYILFEANNLTNELLLIFEGVRYKVVQEGYNTYMYSESGSKLPLIESSLNSLQEISSLDKNGVSVSGDEESMISLVNEEVLSTSAITWTQNYGPWYRTNKVIVSAVELISVVGGASTFYFIHPVLGGITTALGVISYVAGLSYATLYIKYYQARNVADLYYCRQQDYYYQYSNYTGYVKMNTWYFYSSNPY